MTTLAYAWRYGDSNVWESGWKRNRFADDFASQNRGIPIKRLHQTAQWGRNQWESASPLVSTVFPVTNPNKAGKDIEPGTQRPAPMAFRWIRLSSKDQIYCALNSLFYYSSENVVTDSLMTSVKSFTRCWFAQKIRFPNVSNGWPKREKHKHTPCRWWPWEHAAHRPLPSSWKTQLLLDSWTTIQRRTKPSSNPTTWTLCWSVWYTVGWRNRRRLNLRQMAYLSEGASHVEQVKIPRCYNSKYLRYVSVFCSIVAAKCRVALLKFISISTTQLGSPALQPIRWFWDQRISWNIRDAKMAISGANYQSCYLEKRGSTADFLGALKLTGRQHTAAKIRLITNFVRRFLHITFSLVTTVNPKAIVLRSVRYHEQLLTGKLVTL